MVVIVMIMIVVDDHGRVSILIAMVVILISPVYAEWRRFDRPDGSIMHAEMRIDDSVIMVSEASVKFPVITVLLHLCVTNVDDGFDRAMQAGCGIIEKLKVSQGDPDKHATFTDFAGNMWSNGTKQ